MTDIRVLVVDNEPLMRQALKIILEAAPGFQWLGEATNGIEAVDFCVGNNPDVILMDMQMPRMDGVEATSIITTNYPGIGVLAITAFSSEEYLVPALRAGAAGYLVKDAEPTEILAAIQAVQDGSAAISASVSQDLIRAIREAHDVKPSSSIGTNPMALSEREQEVLQLLARGRNNPEMAAELHISEATVKAHLSRVMAKFGVRDRVQALIRAAQYGLVELHMD
ncbi:response regulator [Paeniglutamicibacter psychrophenolicus]|uniref:response regulator n=1 Tax=Paeniglutamicibacter psychrophenolicus TaxID=257454 RepID=UPI00278A170E|nr:response regulator transcription factor [Paeniglutamicibacter psychrophenolicus]MDQ0093668.1 DNA-binding NarL/FixJ family response regulator [Paeniglutamicibacter psychrophenolicus]